MPEELTTTQRGLKHAIGKLDDFSPVVYVVSSERVAELVCDELVEMGVERASRPSMTFRVGDRILKVISALAENGRGYRAHFVLDHSVAYMPYNQSDRFMRTIMYAHEGPWPPQMLT